MSLTPAIPLEAPIRCTRRGFLRRAGLGVLGLVGTGGATGSYAHWVEVFWPATETVPMGLPGLGPGWVGRRLMQLSDLHLVDQRSAEYLAEQMDRCTAMAPDIVVITGDFITAGHLGWLPVLEGIIRRLKAPLGVYAIFGNHDYGVYNPCPRPRGPGLADRLQSALTDWGVRVLQNEATIIEADGSSLQLVGISDLWSGYCRPTEAFRDAARDLPTIALTHNPDSVPMLTNWHWHWVLCGHTHGGQVRIPLLGAPILPIRNRRFDAGRFNLDGRWVYVNRGLGSLHQIRFNCRPEITLFELARSE